MRCFFILIYIVFCGANAFSQVGIEGTVTDAQTGEPIIGVHVYISQSQIGDYTVVNGSYQLKSLERRTFTLVFSHVGYLSQVFEISNLSSLQTLDIVLEEDVTQLGEVQVDGKVDRKWGRYLKRFKNAFLGANHDESLIAIENDYIVDFNSLKGRDFNIENQPILNIINKHLGYEIEFQLLEFQESKGNSYFGYSNFKEMTDIDMKGQWDINRERAYNGSLRHFFKAIINNRHGENGFAATLVFEKDDRVIQSTPSLINESREPLRVEQVGPQSANVSVESVGGQYYEIQFDRLLEVVYFDELDGFGDPQTSMIKLTAPLEVYPNGIIKNPKVMIVYGFLADRGVYEFLPFEYEPSK